MIARLENLRRHPSVFRHLTGLGVRLFGALAEEVVPAVEAARLAALARPGRRRAVGGGDRFDLPVVDQLLLTVVWLRHYPTQECLGFLFGVSDSTALRAVRRCLPALAASGRDGMRLPDPGRGRRKPLPSLLAECPGLAAVVDSFEQPIQRPARRQRAYYSGKKKRHTLKSQVVADEETGEVCHVGPSRPGPWADIKVFRRSGVKSLLPRGLSVIGDSGYPGIDKEVRRGAGGRPRPKPPKRPRPAEDRRYNRAFARRRVIVEHTIGRLRRYKALAEQDRHWRWLHTERVQAAAGLVNRQIRDRLAA
jgi:hypothetical protein